MLAQNAGRKFEKALACDPNDVYNQQSYGLYLCFIANDLLAHAVQAKETEKYTFIFLLRSFHLRGILTFFFVSSKGVTDFVWSRKDNTQRVEV